MPRQYVLNTSKQFLNHFNSEYEMFWEAFCNSVMVTKKFLSTKEAIKGTHTRTHIHSWNCPLHHPETLHQGSKHNHIQGKGALKLESHFQQHHHQAIRNHHRLSNWRGRKTPKCSAVQKAKHMAVMLGYETWMQHDIWCYCRQVSGMEETVERERDKHFVQTHIMAFTKEFWDVSFY